MGVRTRRPCSAVDAFELSDANKLSATALSSSGAAARLTG